MLAQVPLKYSASCQMNPPRTENQERKIAVSQKHRLEFVAESYRAADGRTRSVDVSSVPGMREQSGSSPVSERGANLLFGIGVLAHLTRPWLVRSSISTQLRIRRRKAEGAKINFHKESTT
jgi:hypothetical protein